jgi:plastocyanin
MIIIFLLAAIVSSGCLQERNVVGGNTVEITSSGFSPEILKIKAGETVTFVNKDAKPHWPASGMHPTHTDYPESGGCIGSTFDACGGLKTGESFAFTFYHKGEWDYHDHLNSGLTGKIIVE